MGIAKPRDERILPHIIYKIATKSIANRLKRVLNSIISPEQTGFIKGRYIGENIRILCETLEHVEENQIPSILFFADFEKAFDSLDHDFMLDVFKHFWGFSMSVKGNFLGYYALQCKITLD